MPHQFQPLRRRSGDNIDKRKRIDGSYFFLAILVENSQELLLSPAGSRTAVYEKRVSLMINWNSQPKKVMACRTIVMRSRNISKYSITCA